MNYRDIALLRLNSQQLVHPGFTRTDELVRWMGCIQAQDFGAAKWGIGNRMTGVTNTNIESDFNEGRILRTHVLRPTWHFITPDDIRWILKLTAKKIRTLNIPHLKKLGIVPKDLTASKKLFETALRDNRQLTRTELADLLRKKKINTDEFRMAYHLMDAELEGLICSGARRDRQFTYALLEDRVPRLKPIYGNDAIGELLKRYFQSRGPATLRDFCWWSGLSLINVKQAMAVYGKDLVCEKIKGDAYWFYPVLHIPTKKTGIRLLPAYDEYAVGYNNRSAILDTEQNKSTGNGIFKPIIIQNGKIAGVWRKTELKGKIILEKNLFTTLSGVNTASLKTAEKKYLRFLSDKK